MNTDIYKDSLILVVDDSPENLLIFTEHLEMAGYKTVTAIDGLSALECAAQHNPDLILLDVKMPKMTGFEVCGRLKSSSDTHDIPIIFMTALKDSDNVVKGFDLGAQDYIVKPFQIEELLVRVRNQLALKKLRQQLEEANQDLEQRVHERTEELHKANESLRKEIDERKLTEIKLTEALSKAEESNRLKSSFLMMVSHEIRTPLNAILGFASLLIRESFDDETNKFLKIIHDNGQQLLQIINDIIDLSQIEASRLKISQEPCLLEDIFCKVSAKAETMLAAKQKPIPLEWELSPTLNHLILGDPVRLQQILDNLISNAIKFTQQGKVSFGVKLSSNNQLEFHVKDTGIGIPEDMQEIVFDNFQQADMSESRQFGGLGLGLSISQRLIKLMDGRIWLESKTGENSGTTVFFTLPYHPLDSDSLDDIEVFEDTDVKNILDDKTILLVEDDFSCQLLVNEYLRRAGATVLLAENGEEAIKALEKEPAIDLVLMDLQMPVMDGLQATEAIKALNSDESDKDIPVIALTAASMKGDRERCLMAGCDDYLSKPVSRKDLVRMVVRHLTKK